MNDDEISNHSEPNYVWFRVRVPSGPEYLAAVVSAHEKGENTDFPQNRAVEAMNSSLHAGIKTSDLHPCEESDKPLSGLSPVESRRDDVKLWEIEE